MAQSSLPPGFRFHPTDIELVSYYLKRKVMGKPYRFQAISEIELYKFAPWDLPDKSCLKSKDLEWYFFCPRDRKYANGSRTNRATDIGYWKTTGKDRHITYNFRTVGMKRTLIFHIGKAPRGDRTDWVMHEYRLEDKELDNTRISQDAYVLCKIFQKSGPGPKNGEQYGAPFKEEDWEDDEAFDNTVSFPLVPSPTPEPLNDQSIMLGPVHLFESSEPGEVSSMPDPLDGVDADGIFLEQLDEILNSSPLHSGNANDEIHRYLDEIFSVDTEGIYNGLEDLSGLTELEPTDCISLFNDLDNKYPLPPMIPEHDHDQYLELNDLHFIGKSDPEHDHDQYLELNDLHFIGKSDPLLVPDDMFVHDSFAHFPIDNTNFYIDTALTTESVLRDPLPKGPDIFTNHFHFFPKMNAFESTQRSNALVCEPDDSCSVDLFQGLAGGSDSVPSTNNTNGSCS